MHESVYAVIVDQSRYYISFNMFVYQERQEIRARCSCSTSCKECITLGYAFTSFLYVPAFDNKFPNLYLPATLCMLRALLYPIPVYLFPVLPVYYH